MDDLYIKNGIVIPAHEIEITASRAGGPGGQHVNKTSTRISLRWNIRTSKALMEEQKDQVIAKLKPELTTQDELIIHAGSSRSQAQNKQEALKKLAHKLYAALRVPKKRMKTKASASAKAKRIETKKRHGEVKKLRKKIEY